MYFTLWDVGIFCLVGLVSLTRAGSNKEDRQPSISIVGGTAALPGEFPALGAILLPSLTTPGKYQAICAGTLITPSHILTAAHCAVMLRTGRSFAYQVFYPKVIFTNDLYQSVKAVIRTLTRAIVHENWNTSNQLNDIAVILLDSPITTLPLTKLPVANSIALGVPKPTATTGRSTTRRSTTRRSTTRRSTTRRQTTGRQTTGRPTMKQPTKKQDFKPKARALATRAFSSYANARAVIAGWGTTIYGASDSNSNLLLKANVTIHDNSVCIKQYHGKVIFYPTEMLCASDPGRDTCEGDSGGPIYVNGTQVGITSWGVGCAASNYAGVYTRVTNYVDWIATTVAKNQPKNTAFAVNKQTRQN